jgi:dTDP-glucose pyrophosphorylase
MADAIEILDNQKIKIVVVLNHLNQLVGTVTDGDIRRALINHIKLSSLIDRVMNINPVAMTNEKISEVSLEMIKNKSIFYLPIIDEDRKVYGLKTFNEIYYNIKIENPVFLMAGGYGKRLLPLTNNIPKPLLKVGEKPILETILNQFLNFGFCNFFISTHYEADQIRDYFGDGSKWGVSINYIHEDEPLGTAGALGLLPKYLENFPIIMMNGDLLTKVDLRNLLDFHNNENGVATMCVREYDFKVPYGVVTLQEDQVKKIEEKPVHSFFVNAGIYVLNRSVVESVDGKTYVDMPNLLESQIKLDNKVNVFPIHEYWIDIGELEQFNQAQVDLKGNF